MSELRVRVLGTPIPQGSKTAAVTMKGGKPRAFLRDANGEKLKPWRQEVTTATRNATGATPGFTPYDEPLEVQIAFYFTRPGNHFGSGRNDHILKASAPLYVAVTPDVDKLTRAILDGMADGGAFVNDSRVAVLHCRQMYAAAGQPPGADITIRPLTHPAPPSGVATHPLA